jgi:hypothetical protein
MIEINKKVRNSLSQLLVIGVIYILSGFIISIILLKSFNTIPLIYLPLIVGSAVLGYVMIYRIDPGGTVNFYLRKHKRTKDEETLYKLIVKYRSTFFIHLIACSFIFTILVVALYSKNRDLIFSADIFIGATIFAFAGAICLGTGIKYISAWWNIKKAGLKVVH